MSAQAPVSVDAVANYFLDLGDRDSVPISPLKLQKLAYCAHGWHLALRDKPLFQDRIEAWKYGPVVPSLYNEFRRCGSNPIQVRAVELRPDPVGLQLYKPSISRQLAHDPKELKQVQSLLDRVWEVYHPLTATQLSNLTHLPGSPWHQICRQFNGKIPASVAIPDDLIKNHFKSLASEANHT